MFAIPSRVQRKHHKRRRSWSEGINNRTQPDTPARSRTHSIDLPSGRNVSFKFPGEEQEEEEAPMMDIGVEVKTDAEPLDEIDTTLPKASTAKIRGNPPIFNFTFPDSDNESSAGDDTKNTTNVSNNNDIALKDFPFGAPQDPTVQSMKDPPKIVITRTPTKTFLTERVPEV